MTEQTVTNRVCAYQGLASPAKLHQISPHTLGEGEAGTFLVYILMLAYQATSACVESFDTHQGWVKWQYAAHVVSTIQRVGKDTALPAKTLTCGNGARKTQTHTIKGTEPEPWLAFITDAVF